MKKRKVPRISRSFKDKYPVANSLIVVTGVVAVWRGLWDLMDLYLFPDQPVLSYVVSFLVGVFVLWIDDFRLTELSE